MKFKKITYKHLNADSGGWDLKNPKTIKREKI